ncbi:hypothetical protein BDY17DRAFT_23390 [Neohortaea acidophila]|uniref:Uncharacterized protein n=1 Tax=Neohortaea acidophila TaxID=245834 RepID=A0A6A6Q9I6_9PEZI|nr:uncharacterized protein BDY17DRAFT_23390 [Neohortaea acidophila]KAF2488067.1 hypothetical protein BDY17DRAFT_23390 [Neohortaea acidophila]
MSVKTPDTGNSARATRRKRKAEREEEEGSSPAKKAKASRISQTSNVDATLGFVKDGNVIHGARRKRKRRSRGAKAVVEVEGNSNDTNVKDEKAVDDNGVIDGDDEAVDEEDVDAVESADHDETTVALNSSTIKQAKKTRNRARRESKTGASSLKPTLEASERGTSGQHKTWTASAASAGRFLQHDPAFVQNGKDAGFLISANAREVQLLSLETSLVVRSHSSPSDKTVAHFAVDAIDNTLVHIAYDDGAINTWDWDNDTATTPVSHAKLEVVAMASGRPFNGTKSSLFYIAALKRRHAVFLGNEKLFETKAALTSILVVGNSDYLVCSGPSVLIIGSRLGRAAGEITWIEMPLSFTCTCLDARLSTLPNATTKSSGNIPVLSLAMGLEDGQIMVYSDVTSLFKSQALPTPRILHWHRRAVSAIRYSRDGNYIISGGKETVLVIWQLETGKKQYLPHLTSEINGIVVSPEGSRYALRMGDNSIVVLSTSELKPLAHFAGLQVTGRIATHLYPSQQSTIAAVLHPTKPHTLLAAVPPSIPRSENDVTGRPFLQTFDTRNSRHISRQALTRNNVTDFTLGPDRTPIVTPDVIHLAISHDGQLLATVDEWMPPLSDLGYLASDELDLDGERQKRREVFLKIWNWNEDEGLWTLSTRVDAPHGRANGIGFGAGRVLALASAPSSDTFATVGEDECVRVWSPKGRTRRSAIKTEPVSWVCKSSTQLPRAESAEETEPTGLFGASLTYSNDGSLLAVAPSDHDAATEKAPITHFLDASTGAVAASKAGLARAELKDIAFLGRYFVAVSTPAAHVWDLVDDVLMYKIDFPGPAGAWGAGHAKLAVSQDEGSFAVVVGDNVVEVYAPQSTTVLYRHEFDASIEGLLASKGTKGYTLIFSDATIRTVSPAGAEKVQPRLKTTFSLAASKFSSAGAEEIGQAGVAADAQAPVLGTVARVQDVEEDDRLVVRPEQLARVFDFGQTSAMPPVRDMFQAVVGLFARKPAMRPQAVRAS